ncbi:MAG: DUF5013 domain-containing protein [Bacteroidaceae bacterium]|nr:DUF5013 domain-containing protein [Bacteroidaceae bacterium]
MKKLFSLIGLIAAVVIFAYASKPVPASEPATLEDGNYYLYNVASGKWLGGGNSWGTQASLLKHANYFTLTKVETGVYTLDSHISNGGDSHFFGNGGYVDGTAANWQIQQNGENYVLTLGDGNFIGWDGETTVLKTDITSAADENAQWKIYSEAEMIAQIKKTPYGVPVDATFLIKGADFSRNDQRIVQNWKASADCTNKNLSGGDNTNNCAESWHSTFTISQTIENVPNGKYQLTAQGFYRQDGTDNDNLPYFFLNDQKSTVLLKTGAEDNMGDASASFTAGNYAMETPLEVVVNDGTLNLGIANPANAALWVIFDNFELTYLGVDLSTLETALENARAAAKVVIDANEKMNKDVFAALNTTYDNTETVVHTPEAYEAAIANLNMAVTAAKASIAVYASIQKWYDDAKVNFTEEGYTNFCAVTADIKAAYDNGTITDGVAENETLKEQYAAHMAKYYAPGADITDVYIVNARLLEGANGWNCNPARSGGDGLNDGKIGVLEFYAGWGSLEMTKFEMLQTINLPAGEYKLSSNAFFRYGVAYDTDKTKSEAYMVCGNDKTLLPTLGSIEGLSGYANSTADAITVFEAGKYETSTTFKLLEASDVTVGYSGEFTLKQSWFISGPLKLTYVGPVSLEGYIADLNEVLAKVPEGMMEKSLKQALIDAVTLAQVVLAKYNADPTSVTAKEANDACEALKIAINNAEPSVKIYKSVKDAADKAQALDEDGQKKFDELIADVRTAYYDGTITDGVAEIETINNALIEATKAQTSKGSDWSLLGSNKPADWFGGKAVFQTGVEHYTGDNVAAPDTIILSQTIGGLIPFAKYEVKFYAGANVARNLSEDYYGEGKAYVFANAAKEDIVIGHQSGDTITKAAYLRTFEVTVGADGNLEFGLANKVEAGQWYIAQFVSLTLLDAPEGLSKMILAGLADKAAGETLTIDLNKGEEYPLNVPVDAGLVNLVINGNGAIVNVGAGAQITGMQGIEINNVNFNCAEATVAPVALSVTPDESLHASNGNVYNNTQNAYINPCTVAFNGCNFAQLPTSLFSNNGAAWVLGGFTVNECVVQFCKSDTKPYINFETAPNNVGAIKNFTINASTLFNDSIDDAYFIRFANASNGQASKAFPADPYEYITFTNNTFVNICTKKNFGNNTQNNAAFVDEIKGNVFFNVYRLNKYIQTNNTFNFTVADNAINGDIVTIDGTDKSKIATEDTLLVLTLPEGALNFNNIMALKANFTNPAGSYAAEMGFGDPRWIPLPPITEARGWKFDNMPTDWADDWAGIIQAANDGNGYWAASSKGRYNYVPALNDEQLTFDGTTVIPAFEGLYFTDANINGILVCPANGATYRCAQFQAGVITRIPQVAAGDTIKLVLCNTEKGDIEEGMTFTNALDAEGNAVTSVTTPASTYTEFVFVAAANGDFTFKVAKKGIRLQTINVIPEGSTPTGINDVNSKVTVPFAEGIYNLRGQKVTTMKAGEIYLVNGKKFIAR